MYKKGYHCDIMAVMVFAELLGACGLDLYLFVDQSCSSAGTWLGM